MVAVPSPWSGSSLSHCGHLRSESINGKSCPLSLFAVSIWINKSISLNSIDHWGELGEVTQNKCEDLELSRYCSQGPISNFSCSTVGHIFEHMAEESRKWQGPAPGHGPSEWSSTHLVFCFWSWYTLFNVGVTGRLRPNGLPYNSVHDGLNFEGSTCPPQPNSGIRIEKVSLNPAL